MLVPRLRSAVVSGTLPWLRVPRNPKRYLCLACLHHEQNNSSHKGNSRKQESSPKLTAVFEYACGVNSMLGRVHAELKVAHVRLSKDGLNVQDPRIAEQLHSQLRDPAKKHLWVSLPCTSGCPEHSGIESA